MTIEYISLSFWYINIFSALLLNEDFSFAQAKRPPCELNSIYVLTTDQTRTQTWPVIYIKATSTPVASGGDSVVDDLLFVVTPIVLVTCFIVYFILSFLVLLSSY